MSESKTDKHFDSLAVKVGKLEASHAQLSESLATLATTVREGFASIYRKMDQITVGRQTRWSEVATIAGFVVAAITAMVLGYVQPLAQRLDMENRHAERLLQVNTDWQRRFDSAERHWTSKVDETYSLYRAQVVGEMTVKIDEEVKERQDLRHRHIALDKRVTSELAALSEWRRSVDEKVDQQHRWGSAATGHRQKLDAQYNVLSERLDRLERRQDHGRTTRTEGIHAGEMD